MLRRAKPDVLIVPPGLVLELFSLARFAGQVGLVSEAIRIFLGLRRMRPDVPEFSSYPALLFSGDGNYAEAKQVLEEYIACGFDDCSLVYSLLGYICYVNHDPAWLSHAMRSIEVAKHDGGSTKQRELLALLPTDYVVAH